MNQQFLTPPPEIYTRIEKMRSIIRNRNIDAAWISHHVNLFYFTGSAQTGHLLILKDVEPVFFVRKYYPRACEESSISDIRQIHNLIPIRDFFKKAGVRKIGLEMDVLPASQFLKLRETVKSGEFLDVSFDIRKIRMIKSQHELGWIKKAAGLLDQVFKEIPYWLKPGMTEIELASIIEGYLRKHGHQGYLPMRTFNGALFYGNIVFGASGAVRGPFDGPTNGPGLYPAIPAGAGFAKLESHQPIFIDIVAGIAGYMADATRVFSIGILPNQLSDAHSICIEIQNSLAQRLTAERSGESLYDLGMNLARKSGLADFFMGTPDDHALFIAHGFGLEIDELPLIANRYDFPILPGSTLAIEPKFVFPRLGAVGIENSFFVMEGSYERLTQTPDAIITV